MEETIQTKQTNKKSKQTDKTNNNKKQKKTEQTKKQQKNKQTAIFLPKINIVFSEQSFIKSGPFWTIYLWKWFCQRAEKDAVKQKFLSFKDDGQKRKLVVEFTLFLTAIFYPFLKGFYKLRTARIQTGKIRNPKMKIKDATAHLTHLKIDQM